MSSVYKNSSGPYLDHGVEESDSRNWRVEFTTNVAVDIRVDPNRIERSRTADSSLEFEIDSTQHCVTTSSFPQYNVTNISNEGSSSNDLARNVPFQRGETHCHRGECSLSGGRGMEVCSSSLCLCPKINSCFQNGPQHPQAQEVSGERPSCDASGEHATIEYCELPSETLHGCKANNTRTDPEPDRRSNTNSVSKPAAEIAMIEAKARVVNKQEPALDSACRDTPREDSTGQQPSSTYQLIMDSTESAIYTTEFTSDPVSRYQIHLLIQDLQKISSTDVNRQDDKVLDAKELSAKVSLTNDDDLDDFDKNFEDDDDIITDGNEVLHSKASSENLPSPYPSEENLAFPYPQQFRDGRVTPWFVSRKPLVPSLSYDTLPFQPAESKVETKSFDTYATRPFQPAVSKVETKSFDTYATRPFQPAVSKVETKSFDTYDTRPFQPAVSKAETKSFDTYDTRSFQPAVSKAETKSFDTYDTRSFQPAVSKVETKSFGTNSSDVAELIKLNSTLQTKQYNSDQFSQHAYSSTQDVQSGQACSEPSVPETGNGNLDMDLDRPEYTSAFSDQKYPMPYCSVQNLYRECLQDPCLVTKFSAAAKNGHAHKTTHTSISTLQAYSMSSSPDDVGFEQNTNRPSVLCSFRYGGNDKRNLVIYRIHATSLGGIIGDISTCASVGPSLSEPLIYTEDSMASSFGCRPDATTGLRMEADPDEGGDIPVIPSIMDNSEMTQSFNDNTVSVCPESQNQLFVISISCFPPPAVDRMKARLALTHTDSKVDETPNIFKYKNPLSLWGNLKRTPFKHVDPSSKKQKASNLFTGQTDEQQEASHYPVDGSTNESDPKGGHDRRHVQQNKASYQSVTNTDHIHSFREVQDGANLQRNNNKDNSKPTDSADSPRDIPSSRQSWAHQTRGSSLVATGRSSTSASKSPSLTWERLLSIVDSSEYNSPFIKKCRLSDKECNRKADACVVGCACDGSEEYHVTEQRNFSNFERCKRLLNRRQRRKYRLCKHCRKRGLPRRLCKKHCMENKMESIARRTKWNPFFKQPFRGYCNGGHRIYDRRGINGGYRFDDRRVINCGNGFDDCRDINCGNGFDDCRGINCGNIFDRRGINCGNRFDDRRGINGGYRFDDRRGINGGNRFDDRRAINCGNRFEERRGTTDAVLKPSHRVRRTPSSLELESNLQLADKAAVRNQLSTPKRRSPRYFLSQDKYEEVAKYLRNTFLQTQKGSPSSSGYPNSGPTTPSLVSATHVHPIATYKRRGYICKNTHARCLNNNFSHLCGRWEDDHRRGRDARHLQRRKRKTEREHLLHTRKQRKRKHKGMTQEAKFSGKERKPKTKTAQNTKRSSKKSRSMSSKSFITSRRKRPKRLRYKLVRKRDRSRSVLKKRRKETSKSSKTCKRSKSHKRSRSSCKRYASLSLKIKKILKRLIRKLCRKRRNKTPLRKSRGSKRSISNPSTCSTLSRRKGRKRLKRRHSRKRARKNSPGRKCMQRRRSKRNTHKRLRSRTSQPSSSSSASQPKRRRKRRKLSRTRARSRSSVLKERRKRALYLKSSKIRGRKRWSTSDSISSLLNSKPKTHRRRRRGVNRKQARRDMLHGMTLKREYKTLKNKKKIARKSRKRKGLYDDSSASGHSICTRSRCALQVIDRPGSADSLKHHRKRLKKSKGKKAEKEPASIYPLCKQCKPPKDNQPNSPTERKRNASQPAGGTVSIRTISKTPQRPAKKHSHSDTTKVETTMKNFALKLQCAPETSVSFNVNLPEESPSSPAVVHSDENDAYGSTGWHVRSDVGDLLYGGSSRVPVLMPRKSNAGELEQPPEALAIMPHVTEVESHTTGNKSTNNTAVNSQVSLQRSDSTNKRKTQRYTESKEDVTPAKSFGGHGEGKEFQSVFSFHTPFVSLPTNVSTSHQQTSLTPNYMAPKQSPSINTTKMYRHQSTTSGLESPSQKGVNIPLSKSQASGKQSVSNIPLSKSQASGKQSVSNIPLSKSQARGQESVRKKDYVGPFSGFGANVSTNDFLEDSISPTADEDKKYGDHRDCKNDRRGKRRCVVNNYGNFDDAGQNGKDRHQDGHHGRNSYDYDWQGKCCHDHRCEQHTGWEEGSEEWCRTDMSTFGRDRRPRRRHSWHSTHTEDQESGRHGHGCRHKDYYEKQNDIIEKKGRMYDQARRLLRQICYLKQKEETMQRAAIRFQHLRLQLQEHHSMLFMKSARRYRLYDPMTIMSMLSPDSACT